ncbi:MAG: leucyl/phenylalanyl-tRNA--protein transferase [Aeromonadaceae bacterium]|nr:leucyl/phenylalanyl-tRNA--protein transferase [Aeromonadaceae bacterium]
MELVQLDESELAFPPVEQALSQPNGLLAIGGDLSPQRILSAYRQGIFPWFGAHQPILWWSPDPRGVLVPEAMHCSRSLLKELKRHDLRCWINRDFAQVIQACAAPRRDCDETWISREMQAAYLQLHHAGLAHSVEIWQGEQLVGGLYGLAIGSLFCGESMFSRRTNASKLALYYLCQHWQTWGGRLIDCQMQNSHLETLGVVEWPRARFMAQLALCRDETIDAACWRLQEVVV